MDVVKMLAELRSEREAIEEAILTLERLAQGQGRRRGRPPAWLSAIRKEKDVHNGGRTRSAKAPAVS